MDNLLLAITFVGVIMFGGWMMSMLERYLNAGKTKSGSAASRRRPLCIRGKR